MRIFSRAWKGKLPTQRRSFSFDMVYAPTMKSLILIAWLGVSTLVTSVAVARCDLELLARYAYRTPGGRTSEDKAYWFHYKNTPAPRPTLWDLSDPDPYATAPEIANWPRIIGVNQHQPFIPTAHERDLLLMRKGDIVIFDGCEYRIDEFFGAGNSTHVYSVVQPSELVLGVPFLSGFWGQILRTGTRPTHLHDMRYSMEISTVSLQGKRHAVRVYSDPSGRYRYRFTTKVRGRRESGWELIQRLFPDVTIGQNVYSLKMEAVENLQDRVRLERLISYLMQERDFSAERASDFLWDEDRTDWLRIDGDDSRWY